MAWFWVPEWDLPPGAASTQEVLAYPAANLVVSPDDVRLWGAATRRTERVLTGTAWAVGALLRPAALAALAAEPVRLVDGSIAVAAPELVARIRAVMPGGAAAASARLGAWLNEQVGARTSEARLANAMAELLMTDTAMLRVEDAAARLAVSVRTLQRLAHRTIGLSPAAVIRRRRLQEAVQRVREHPDEPLAGIAAELGYADQAHLASDFRRVLGFTASRYRCDRSPS
nr:helix-turn-helix domain-containing protein [Microbacterium bovistercoris]